MTRFLVVPQWQGSPSSRAMQLIDGAEALAGDLPRASCTRIDVPLEAGDAGGTRSRRLSSVSRTRDQMAAAIDGFPPDEPFVVVGGDCSIAVPAVAAAAMRHAGVAVVWFDAHADLHSPETSPSGALSGMALRNLFEDGDLPSAGVDAQRVVLAGARDMDHAEHELAAASAVRVLTVADLADPEALVAAVADTGADALYIHIDVDVLDPAALTGVAMPVPFGMQLPELTAAIGALRDRMPVIGASICGFAPASPAAAVDDLGTILRIIGAVA